ncbi:hypothetical protein J6590_018016 [Homalodisca vitripennis]|nr:hypothetical protein J6590_018016 [Homalodisca vitripennis]
MGQRLMRKLDQTCLDHESIIVRLSESLQESLTIKIQDIAILSEIEAVKSFVVSSDKKWDLKHILNDVG